MIARGVLTTESKLPEIADTEGKRVKRSKEETEALKYGLYCEELGITGVKPQDPKSIKFKLWTWANKFAGRRTAGGKRIDDRDALTYSPSLRAYETSTGDYSQLHRWAEVWSYWWNVIAIQFQNAERSRDFARLKALGNRKNIDAFVEYLKLNTFRRVDVEGEDRPRHERIENPMPIEIERNFRDALAKTLAKGYPRMKEFRALSFSIYFNGNNLGSKNASNTYCKIGEPYSPPNHRGPSCGKYRSRRVIRKIQFRFNGKQTWNELDVLDYRSDLLSHNIKGIRVCDHDGRWTLNPMINDRFEVAEPTKRVFAAIDLNARKDDESISVIDIGGDTPFRQFSMTFTPNRKSRRRAADKRNTDLPVFETTKEGRKAYQRTMDDKKDAIKSLLGEPKESRLGWAGIKRRFAAGQIAEIYVAFVGNSIEIKRMPEIPSNRRPRRPDLSSTCAEQ